MLFLCVCHFSRLHLKQGHQERERRFRALVFVDAVGMEAVSAAARCCVVKRRLQIVLAQKPAKHALGFLKPMALFRQPVNLQASRNHCASLHWLLIESRLLTAFDKEPIRSDRYKDILVVAVLFNYKPLQRIHSGFNHSLVVASPSGKDECLRQPRIRIGKALLEPSPCRRVGALIDVEQSIRQRVSNILYCPVTGEPIQISLHTQNAICPCSRARER